MKILILLIILVSNIIANQNDIQYVNEDMKNELYGYNYKDINYLEAGFSRIYNSTENYDINYLNMKHELILSLNHNFNIHNNDSNVSDIFLSKNIHLPFINIEPIVGLIKTNQNLNNNINKTYQIKTDNLNTICLSLNINKNFIIMMSRINVSYNVHNRSLQIIQSKQLNSKCNITTLLASNITNNYGKIIFKRSMNGFLNKKIKAVAKFDIGFENKNVLYGATFPIGYLNLECNMINKNIKNYRGFISFRI